MKDKLNQIIGKSYLRGSYPSISLEEVKRIEGEPKPVRKTYRPHIKYTKKLVDGEELKLIYYYDDATQLVKSIEVYFSFYPAKHDGSIEDFEKLREACLSHYNKEYGEAKVEEQGTGQSKEYYYYWYNNMDKVPFRIVLMDYLHEDPYDDLYTKRVLKFVMDGHS